MKRGHQEVGRDEGGRRGRCGNGGTYLMDDAAAASASVSKGKSLKKEEEAMMLVQDDGDDELLAALGYKVRSSSMADVAQKLEQLEMAMAVGDGSAFAGFRNGSIAGGGLVMDTDSSVLTNLAAETVHYNPSDLNSWLENMLSELNVPLLPPPSPSTAAECSTMQIIDFSSPTTDFDNLTAIIPAASREKKRIKPSAPPTSSSTSTPLPPPTCLPPSQLPVSLVPVVLVEDSQEAGICLVHALLACADAIQQENLLLAETLVKQITVLTTSQGGAMRKVATYFAEALARRIYQIHPTPSPTPQESLSPDLLEMHFYEACPYLKFAHFTANQAILEAFVGKSHVHVIDFGMKQGLQWPALMQALALRPGGPPVFRLTGVGFPQPNSPNAIQEVGWKLAEFAESLEIKFDYRGLIVNSLVDLEPFMFDTADDHATTAINCILEFHSLLASPRSIEKVLETTKALKPSILTLVEQEAKHNGLVFIDRFTEALHYYSTMFDSLEGDGTTTTAIDSTMGMEGQDLVMAEVYVGKQIFDVVACEGTERKERHETAEQWKARMSFAGFEILPLGSNAYKQASLLLEHFAGGDGYRVEEKDGCLMLGWHTRPLFTTSAWRLASSSAPPPPPPGVTVEGHGSCRR